MFPAELKIRDLSIRPATLLAPMAGVTDTIFRRVIRGLGGCGLIMTEFTAALVEDLGFDQVDVNLGCPAKKVVKCGGSGLLKDLQQLERVLGAVRAAVKIPMTIKMRSGWDDANIVAVEVARMAERIGVEGVAVHPRTRTQAYSGQADWSVIARVKQAVKIPVIGNGDIRFPQDAERMIAETGCDAVMIGRTAATNPWIFQQMEQYFATGRYDEPGEADRYRLLSGYFRSLVAADLPDAIGKMKQFSCWFTHGVTNGAELRHDVHSARSTGEVLERVDAFFASVAGAQEA